ncbi:hypothetical protein ACDX78_02335 [Virgibacillus oceani]
MALSDHYLLEDHEMMADMMEQLLRVTLQMQEDAAKADFTHNGDHLSRINAALKTLMALNAKKQRRDQFNKMEYERRHFF